MHWATLWRHSDLFWAATSASSQVIPILDKQVLVDGAPPVCTQTTWTHLKPWNLPVQRLSRYALVIHSYHMSKPMESSFTEYVIHAMLSSSDSDLCICYSVLPEIPKMLLCHLWRPAFSLFVSVAVGHTSALYRRVDRTIASYNLIFTFRLIHLFFHIFLIFHTLLLLSRCELWRPFHNCHYAICSYQGSRSHQLSRRLSL